MKARRRVAGQPKETGTPFRVGPGPGSLKNFQTGPFAVLNLACDGWNDSSSDSAGRPEDATSGSQGANGAIAAPGVLLVLGDEFNRLLRDRRRLGDAFQWQESGGPDRQPGPIWLDSHHENAPGWRTPDVLRPAREDVATIIGLSGEAGGYDLFRREPDEDVLRLFAPDREGRPSGASLPSLTRREHHTSSIDSPMPIAVPRASGAPSCGLESDAAEPGSEKVAAMPDVGPGAVYRKP